MTALTFRGPVVHPGASKSCTILLVATGLDFSRPNPFNQPLAQHENPPPPLGNSKPPQAMFTPHGACPQPEALKVCQVIDRQRADFDRLGWTDLGLNRWLFSHGSWVPG